MLQLDMSTNIVYDVIGGRRWNLEIIEKLIKIGKDSFKRTQKANNELDKLVRCQDKSDLKKESISRFCHKIKHCKYTKKIAEFSIFRFLILSRSYKKSIPSNPPASASIFAQSSMMKLMHPTLAAKGK